MNTLSELPQKEQQSSLKAASDTGTFRCVFVLEPEFPGGKKALMRYIRESVRYPEAAKKAGVTGRVFASFVIDTVGQVSQVQILKGLGYGCDEEAVQIVSGLPRWKPGTQSGRVVAVKYNLPIDFPPKQPDPLREN